MSKSTLSITVPVTPAGVLSRTIEVPCRLPEAFNFTSQGETFTATLHDWTVFKVEYDGTKDFVNYDHANSCAGSILATIKAALGITGPVPPGSPLSAIALAYEAEVAAYEACVKAHAALPRELHSPSNLNAHPSEREWSGPVVMLAKYVEHVVEQAAKVTP